MSVLAGMYHPSAGSIEVNGKPVSFSSPRDAIQAGIGMIHQHFMLVPSQTVTENILLGLDRPRFRMNLATYDKEIAELSERFHLHVDPHAKIWQLSVGEQQRVEILKMLYRGAQVLIMDEPTAVLAPLEIEELFKTLRSMVSDGKSIIFISHKLNEVLEIADRVSVLRHGKTTAANVSTEGVTRADLARLMVGRNVVLFVEKEPMQPGEVVLSVENVHAESDRGLPAVRGVSLTVRANEIVGLAGVAGNGQRELSDAINGLRKCQQGRVLLNGEEISNQPVRKNIKGGLAYVPEDRNHVGTAPSLSITDNVIMKKYQDPPIGRGTTVDYKAAAKFANELKETVRHRRAECEDAGAAAVGRQLAARDSGPRDVDHAQSDDRRAAHARPGHRRDRGRPQIFTGRTRGGRGRAVDLRRVGRTAGVVRPHLRDLRRPDHGRSDRWEY